MKQALLMVRFQGSKQAFKVRNQVDLRRIALWRNNLTWIDRGFLPRIPTVNYGGAGITYNEVVSAVQHRNVNQVTIYGYSHGGGSTFVLANLLNNNRGAIGAFTIPFTAYIDAVEDDDLWDSQQEHRRPPSSGFHITYYQEGHIADGDYGLDGGPMIPPMPPGEGFEDNVDQPTPTETHGTIDDEPAILNDIETGLTSRVAR